MQRIKTTRSQTQYTSRKSNCQRRREKFETSCQQPKEKKGCMEQNIQITLNPKGTKTTNLDLDSSTKNEKQKALQTTGGRSTVFTSKNEDK